MCVFVCVSISELVFVTTEKETMPLLLLLGNVILCVVFLVCVVFVGNTFNGTSLSEYLLSF